MAATASAGMTSSKPGCFSPDDSLADEHARTQTCEQEEHTSAHSETVVVHGHFRLPRVMSAQHREQNDFRRRLTSMREPITLSLSLLICQIAVADCGPADHESFDSPNGRFTLELSFNYQPKAGRRGYEFVFREGKTVLGSGPIAPLGHHLSAYVSDLGDRFLLVDGHEGLAVYDAQGRTLGLFPDTQLLSQAEQARRPHKWACHPEGVWIDESRKAKFLSPEEVEFYTYTGHRRVINLATGQFVRGGEAEPPKKPISFRRVLLYVVLGTAGGFGVIKGAAILRRRSGRATHSQKCDQPGPPEDKPLASSSNP
jgi:catechol 2,3-dioxygenase-like lactoylglutathione lyase family enzyme